MADKELKDWCKTCNVEPPAMKFKCPECEHNPDKEQIMIDGVDVSKCRYFLKNTEGQDYNTDEFVKGCCEAKGSCIGYEFAGYGLCRGDKDCNFKQLARKTQECEKLEKELDKEHLLMLEKQDKATRYFLILNRIKEYIYNNTNFDVNDSIQSKTSGYDILQIIKDV